MIICWKNSVNRRMPSALASKLDYVFAVLEEVPLEKPWILYYPKAKTLEALRYAGELRKFHRVQLYPREVETLLLVKEGFV